METRDDRGQHRQKLLPILILELDLLLGIPSDSAVIQRPRKFNADWTNLGGESSS